MAEMLPTSHGAELRQVLGFADDENEVERSAAPASPQQVAAVRPPSPLVPQATLADLLNVVHASAACADQGLDDEIEDEMLGLARAVKAEDKSRIGAGVWTVMRSRHCAKPVAAQLAQMEDEDDELVSFTNDAALSAAVATRPVAMHADGPVALIERAL